MKDGMVPGPPNCMNIILLNSITPDVVAPIVGTSATFAATAGYQIVVPDLPDRLKYVVHPYAAAMGATVPSMTEMQMTVVEVSFTLSCVFALPECVSV